MGFLVGRWVLIVIRRRGVAWYNHFVDSSCEYERVWGGMRESKRTLWSMKIILILIIERITQPNGTSASNPILDPHNPLETRGEVQPASRSSYNMTADTELVEESIGSPECMFFFRWRSNSFDLLDLDSCDEWSCSKLVLRRRRSMGSGVNYCRVRF